MKKASTKKETKKKETKNVAPEVTEEITAAPYTPDFDRDGLPNFLKVIKEYNAAQENFMKSLNELFDAQHVYTDRLVKALRQLNERTTGSLSTAELPKAEPMADVAEDTSDDNNGGEVTGHFDEDQLRQMTYTDLKSLCAESGVSAKGNRETLIQRLLEVEISAPLSESEDEPEEEPKKPAKKTSKKTSKKSEPEPVEEDDEDEEDESDDEPEDVEEDTDEYIKALEEQIAEMSNEDLAQILSEAGLSVKGKRQALIDRFMDAVLEGKIEWDDGEDADDDEEEPDDEDESEDVDDEDEEEDEDDRGDEEGYDPNDMENPDMTEERKAAIQKLSDKIRGDYKRKKLKIAAVSKWLKQHFDGDDDSLKAIAELTDDDLVEEYIYNKCLYVDDDGEKMEDSTGYEVNGVPYCCGMPLEEDEETGELVCSVCGETYEVE